MMVKVLSYDSHIHPEHEMQFAGHPIIELHGFDE
jgi:hypothetical protein